jgi:tRNA A-37 threonylcarbamoyl transferase component Bud32
MEESIEKSLEDITLEEAQEHVVEELKGGKMAYVHRGEYKNQPYVLKKDKFLTLFHKLHGNLYHRRLRQPKSESDFLKALEETGVVPKVLKSFGKREYMMEYLDGTPLKENIEDEKQMYGVVESLKKIHDKGFYHGDTRVQNIIGDCFIDLQFSGEIKREKDVFYDLFIFTRSVGHYSKKGLENAYKAISDIYSPKTAKELENHEPNYWERRLLRVL